jgi:hypothetical protein
LRKSSTSGPCRKSGRNGTPRKSADAGEARPEVTIPERSTVWLRELESAKSKNFEFGG